MLIQWVGLIAMSVMLSGCGAAGAVQNMIVGDTLTVQSLDVDDPLVLPLDWTTAVFVPGEASSDRTGEATGSTAFYLTDVAVDDLVAGGVENGQVVRIDLLWQPRPGRTPMDVDATNARIMLVLIADGRVGVYGGAGFAEVTRAPGETKAGDQIRIAIDEATLRLTEASPGFIDLLSPGVVQGSFSAAYDVEVARRIHIGASQLLTNALGRSLYVRR